MKHVVVCLALVVMVFAIGCQESNITNPVTAAGPTSPSSVAKLADEVIFLNGEVTLKDVEATNGSWTINGEAEYTLTPDPRGFEVAITVDATIKPTYIGDESCSVSGYSSDVVEGVGNQPIILEKEYVFEGVNGDQRILHINFAVSETSVSVDAMWVVQP